MHVLPSCFETGASWQHCIDSTSARQSKLGATPAAQVSGGQIPPSAKKEKGHCESSLQHIILPPSSKPQTARHLTPLTGDQLKDDSSELSSQAPRLQGNCPPARPNDLAPTTLRNRFRTLLQELPVTFVEKPSPPSAPSTLKQPPLLHLASLAFRCSTSCTNQSCALRLLPQQPQFPRT